MEERSELPPDENGDAPSSPSKRGRPPGVPPSPAMSVGSVDSAFSGTGAGGSMSLADRQGRKKRPTKQFNRAAW